MSDFSTERMSPASTSLPPSTLQPGFVVLQGNRMEMLWDAVSGFIASNPLRPLEQEVFLVQSNGVGEWLKMHLRGRSNDAVQARHRSCGG